MQNKKGFTLVELLAVIVILAVVAIIAIPITMNIIETAKKGAIKDSAYGLASAAEVFVADNLKHGMSENIVFTCTNNKCLSDDGKELTFKGNVKNGYMTIVKDGKPIICVDDEEYYALKTHDDENIMVGEGTCTGDVDPETFEYTVTTSANFGELRVNIKTTPNTDLPSKGGKNNIIVITDVSNSNKYFVGFEAPSEPKEGMIWLQESQYSKASIKSDYQDIPLETCYQFIQDKWETREAYIYDEKWVKFSSKDFWESLVVKA